VFVKQKKRYVMEHCTCDGVVMVKARKLKLSIIKFFTMVELLVVIAVILILVSILLPAAGKAHDTARRILCTNNIKQIGYAECQYLSDNNNYLVPYTTNYGTNRWTLLLNTYLGSPEDYAKLSKSFYCTSHKEIFSNIKPPSFGVVYTNGNNGHVLHSDPTNGYSANISSLKKPSTVISIMEVETGYSGYKGFPAYCKGCFPNSSSGIAFNNFAQRHNNKTVSLFADYHVEALQLNKLIQPAVQNSYDLFNHYGN